VARPRCEAPATLVRFQAPLPHFSTALAAKEPVRIVALGSSSTQGIGASSPKTSYPVMLQAELRRRFPDSKITVDNRGVGGQLATHMLRRMKKDVLSRRPTLVIWQTGVNDAVRHVNVDKFRETVLRGIDMLQEAGIDVVLLDMQYFPRAEKVRDFTRYLVAMRQIAEARKVPIVQRYAIMKHLVTSAQFTPRQLLAADLFHPNDVTYGCLGRLMADALQGEVARRAERVKYPAEPKKQAGAVAPVPVH
jgi:lysophospholipase L1-like esterase